MSAANVTPHPPWLRNNQGLVDACRAEQFPDRDTLTPPICDLKVLLDVLVKVDLVLAQPAEPRGANKFSVGQ